MKKRSKKLLIMLCALVVVIGGVLLIKLFVKEDNTQDTSVPLNIIGEDNEIASLEWVYESEDIKLTKTGDTWAYAEDSSYPLDQTIPKSMADYLSGLTASNAYEKTDELSSYGLSEPAITITVGLSDGTSKQLLVGSMNDITDEYYVKLADSDTVYLVDSSINDGFSYTLYDMVKQEEIPTMSNIKKFTVLNSKFSYMLEYIEDANLTYTNEYVWYLSKQPLDTTKVNALVNSITGLTWSYCKNYNATAEDLKEYGFDAPTTVTIVYGSDTFVLIIGGKTDDGNYRYAKLADSKMVYAIDANLLTDLSAASYSTLKSSAICLLDWDDVSSVTMDMDGTTTKVELNHDSDTATYTVAGKEADSTTVENLLGMIDSLEASIELDSVKVSGDPALTITFKRDFSGYTTMKMSFYRYDSNYYVVSFNGKTSQLITSSDYDSLVDDIKALTE